MLLATEVQVRQAAVASDTVLDHAFPSSGGSCFFFLSQERSPPHTQKKKAEREGRGFRVTVISLRLPHAIVCGTVARDPPQTEQGTDYAQGMEWHGAGT